MVNEIITTQVFERDYKRLSKKYKSLPEDLTKFEVQLRQNPIVGTVLGNGIRKVRLSIKSKNKGKSGGARIITYCIIIKTGLSNIILVTMYDKSEESTKSIQEIQQIISGFFENKE
jgi:hypothetical protein